MELLRKIYNFHKLIEKAENHRFRVLILLWLAQFEFVAQVISRLE